MRRDEPDRHGRAADALIATYLRELLVDEGLEPAPDTAQRGAEAPAAALAAPAERLAADASL